MKVEDLLRKEIVPARGLALQSKNLIKENKMNVPNYRRLTQPRKRLRAEENIKTIYTVPLVLLVLCFSMNPNLCFGESSISLHPEEAFVSVPTENELIQTDEEIVQNFAMAPSEPAGEETVQNSAMTPSEPAEEEAGAEEIPDPAADESCILQI